MRLARLLACLLTLAGGSAMAGEAQDRPLWAITGFGGNLLDDVWEDVFLNPGGLTFEKSYLVGLSVARHIGEPFPGLEFEIEGQVVRYFGGQRHWEFNGPLLTARWRRFPWSLDTSVAFGIGPSIASETPALEVQNQGDSRPLMVYWMIEVDTELPVDNWRLVGRLHHRSPAYGTFGDDGGSNALVLGLRRTF